MVATTHDAVHTPKQASFRNLSSGQIVNTGRCHDIGCLPGGDDANLDEWEAGFTDREGRFYDREQAARLVGGRGRLESESYFAGEEDPTLEAGHLEAWKKPRFREAA